MHQYATVLSFGLEIKVITPQEKLHVVTTVNQNWESHSEIIVPIFGQTKACLCRD